MNAFSQPNFQLNAGIHSSTTVLFLGTFEVSADDLRKIAYGQWLNDQVHKRQQC